MRVIVASTYVPFVDGGGVQIVDWTVEAMRNRGIEAEAMFLPFSDDREVVLAEIAALRSLDLADSCDVLVPIRWPSHVIRHPRKRPWFIHHLRLFMDLWNWPGNPVPHTPATIALREFLVGIDTAALREADRRFTNSEVVRRRVQAFNGLDAEVLYPPLRDGHGPADDIRYEPFVFYPSRVNPTKRQLLAMEAALATTCDARIVIAGDCDDPRYEARLRALAESPEGRERIDLRLGWMTEEDKADCLARCSAVLYLPVDEDSYGYPSLEAHQHGKPVISCTDSGGTSELIVDGLNGLLVEPTPEALSRAIDAYAGAPDRAAEAGSAGLARMAELGIDWDHVVARLTEGEERL